MTFVLLFFAAVLGGALNSVAGGGSFITLPALLYAGITPVVANATSTLALWPGSVSAVCAYRRDIRPAPRTLLFLCSVSLAGGLLGAILLVRTSDTSFMRLLPWLMLAASTTFTFSGRLRLGRNAAGSSKSRRFPASWGQTCAFLLLQLAIATYGGYFGGGMGVMMLAAMSVAGMTDIHEMNGLKSLLGVTINAIALVAFIWSRAVLWTPGLVMVGGAIIGGYAGASVARSIDRRHVRILVVVVGWTMTIIFFLRTR
jgi:uncharacterized protein